MNINKFIEIFKDCEIKGDKIFLESNIAKAVETVKDDYGFSILKEIIAVDKKEEGIELTYNLYSVENDETVRLSTIVKDNAESISKIFDSAVADEKEIYDLFGVKFIGNDELKRLYMPENWKGNPLKKDYMETDERLKWNEQ